MFLHPVINSCVFIVSRTERKRPYEDEINLCKVLLAYLEKHESQTSSTESSSVEAKEVGPTNEGKENDSMTIIEFQLYLAVLGFLCILFYIPFTKQTTQLPCLRIYSTVIAIP